MGWTEGRERWGVVRTEVGFEDIGVGAAAVEAEEAHRCFLVAAVMVNNGKFWSLRNS